jgi:DNA-binding LytR/AlgR family response regulator
VRVFDAREIDRFSAANRYVRFVVDGREQLLDDSLNTLEERLAGHDFVRVHRAELINLRFVVALRRIGGSAEVELASGALVPVSRRLLPGLERRLGARP